MGSHSTNGVAGIHSNLLRETRLKDLAEIFPACLNNKTNGVTPRPWLQLCNPELSRFITSTIGKRWTKNLSELSKLKAFSSDSPFQEDFINAKRTAKRQFYDWLQWLTGQTLDPDSIFDCQVKRIGFWFVEMPFVKAAAYTHESGLQIDILAAKGQQFVNPSA